ncbi:MAG TPA: carboxypeptidase regulatory-like domain-containing protein [Thermoanaerobaculia bacterium]
MFTLFVLIAAAGLAQTHKRRAVVPGIASNEAQLTATIVDASTGRPVAQAHVTAGTHAGFTDATGKITLNVPIGRDVAVTVTRVGYETFTTTLHVDGSSTQTFRVTSKPTVHLRLVTGTTAELDTDSVEFGYSAPFSLTKDSKMNLCQNGGNPFTPDRSEIQRITPGGQISDATCCSSGPIPAVTVQLKSGSSVTAGFVDACFGYKVDVIALDHTTGQPVSFHFSDIAELTFP